MAKYRVTAPDGATYNVEGPDGATEEEVLAQVKAQHQAQPTPAAAPTPPAPSQGGATEFTLGNINKGIAGLAGLPVDTMRNVLNLGIAGYGIAKGALGGTDLPSPIAPGPGSSQWIEEKMRGAGMVKPGAEPESMMGRYGAAALQQMPGALLSPGLAARQIPAALGAGATSGLGAQAATDIGGPEWAAVGAMLPGAKSLAKPPTVGERATAARQAERFQTAKEAGIPVPPRAMKVDKVQQSLQDQLNLELHQPVGTEITPKSLKDYNKGYWKDYEAVIKSPALAKGIKPTATFQRDIQDIGDNIERARTELPETFKTMKPVINLLGEYGYGRMPGGIKGTLPPRQKAIPPDVAMRAIKKLRSDATTNMTSDAPEKVEMGMAQRKIAMSLENLIEENLSTTGSQELMSTFREARTSIAKSHDVESSLDPITRKISGARLSRLLTEGRPLTGRLKSTAEVAGEFPEAMRDKAEEGYFTHRVTPMAMTHPEAMGAHWTTRMWEPITLSKAYQHMVVDPATKLSPEQQQFIRYMSAGQAENRTGELPYTDGAETGMPMPPAGIPSREQMATMSDADLNALREVAFKGNPAAQQQIAPFEHRAFAREAVSESPWKAPAYAAMVPGYQAAKMAGLREDTVTTPASLDQLIQGWTGTKEGLLLAIKRWLASQPQDQSYPMGVRN